MEIKTKQELNSFFSKYKKEVNNTKKRILFKAASSFKERIESEAKNQKQSYGDDLIISNIAGANEIVVHVKESFEKLGNISDAVYYYRPLNYQVQMSPLYVLLNQFAPYPKEYLPIQPGKDFRLIFRRVSLDELEVVMKNLSEAFPHIISSLHKLGISDSVILSHSKIDEMTLVQEDLWFNVLRKELGIRTERIPIWTKAIEDFRKGIYLKEMVKEKLDQKALNIPESSKDLLNEIEDFLEKILKE